ncbi:MAG: hypothetical protein WBD40_00790 [Tepidisphaeraceae bacterium]
MARLIALLCTSLVLASLSSTVRAGDPFTFACRTDNDLFTVLARAGERHARFDTPAEAVKRAAPSSVLLVLADRYPAVATPVDARFYEQAKAKRIRLYVEFPAMVSGIELSAPKQAVWERGIVATDRFGPKLPNLALFSAHGCTFLPAKAPAPLLAIGRVAGFDSAVYGLPKSAQPLLFEANNGDWLIATTKLSGFITGRYAPADRWAAIWEQILRKLDPHAARKLTWTPLAHPAYGADDPLPNDWTKRSFDAAAQWVHRSRLLVSSSRKPLIHKLLSSGIETTDLPRAGDSTGDGTLGMLEGYGSHIHPDGSQPQRTPLRADCIAESAMMLALDGAINPKNARSREVASNLLDYVYGPEMQSMGRLDPTHPAFGLIAWGAIQPAWMVATYGDDEARVLLATAVASAALESDRWNEHLLRGVLANLRTTGKHGFRTDRIDIGPLEAKGWRAYHDGSPVNPALNFEAYLWAVYLWAYQQTGEPELLDKAKTALRMTMELYPKGWRWGDSMERARILLPLAWLVRVEDTPEHRGWISTIAKDLIASQHPSGALPENLKGTGGGHYLIPQSNEAYGTGETPLIQTNGDPASDQLYTTGFALLGLHEAYAATGDAELKAAADKLAAYLARIQVKSDALPYLDGAWFRAFDYRRWDYWSSSADVGWGAWCVEAGWGPAWITAVMGMRIKETSVWEMTKGSTVESKLDVVQRDMAKNDGGPWKKP